MIEIMDCKTIPGLLIRGVRRMSSMGLYSIGYISTTYQYSPEILLGLTEQIERLLGDSEAIRTFLRDPAFTPLSSSISYEFYDDGSISFGLFRYYWRNKK